MCPKYDTGIWQMMKNFASILQHSICMWIYQLLWLSTTLLTTLVAGTQLSSSPGSNVWLLETFIPLPCFFSSLSIHPNCDNRSLKLMRKPILRYDEDKDGCWYFVQCFVIFGLSKVLLFGCLYWFAVGRVDLRQKRCQSQATGEFSFVKCLFVCHNAISYAKYVNTHPQLSARDWRFVFICIIVCPVCACSDFMCIPSFSYLTVFFLSFLCIQF